ncbi:hypothetical protein I302_107628 [Kwoniella bestiolae CBS 10118]|uniref:Ubiquitin-conjugating enzyme E2 J1 n=1 Tax=Kwoniella bestiolae CBS 10118 TaxID=1296100 RepID=A0A1B9FY20_9TREE|nr:ubiquitin-conjugating enzyme E2 J1 [Kwoniella bestiolae CBS 10118]OCF23650.1 ubiquitin-conjugating enzyme E2 J1 [Kwoniella bestiolae CBS 10118]
MSSSRPKVNLRSTAVKRIMQEASELANADIEEDGFVAAPLEDDIFEWHCTMRGVAGGEYDGGLYHLRILLPPSYPMSAPDIMLMTPNGRFELGKKICIDGLTSFHAGSWQPAWGVRTAVVGLRSFWMQSGEALSAIGALDYSKDERKRLANLSRGWKCPNCGVRNEEIIPSSSAAESHKRDEGGVEPKSGDHHDHDHPLDQDQAQDQDQGANDGQEISGISIDPNPQEIPTILPPSTISAGASGSGTGIQALPIDIIPPPIEQAPAIPSMNDVAPQPALPNAGNARDEGQPQSPSPTTPAVVNSPADDHTNTNPTPNATNAAIATAVQPNPQRSPMFYLLDSLILAGVSISIMLVAKRMA